MNGFYVIPHSGFLFLPGIQEKSQQKLSAIKNKLRRRLIALKAYILYRYITGNSAKH